MGTIRWRRDWMAAAPIISTAGHMQSDVGRAEDWKGRRRDRRPGRGGEVRGRRK